MSRLDPRTPVLVGIGIVEQREKDPVRAREAVQLMIDAALASGADCGAPALLAALDRIAVPQGLWAYSDPARLIARAVGALEARTVYAQIGILQQTLFGDACRRIAAGETEVELIAGGEARFRHLQAQIAGVEARETAFSESPDEILAPATELVLEAEAHSGLGYMPVGYYALLESAFRAAHGLGVDAHRDRMAKMYSRFSEIAATNPHAWKRQRVAAAEIRDATARNRMLAFPYTRLHNTSWNVDQAAALLLCSAARAEQAGVPRSRWVFPRASTESNHMLAVAQRAELHRSPGARLCGERALALAGLEAASLDLLELYSCFPIAVEVFAAELGIDPTRDLTVTGGMPFAGGPLNNYVLQATARMAELLRAGTGRHGLVSSVSGYLTKQGIGLWSREPGRSGWEDVSNAVAAASPARRVEPAFDGMATIVGYTVMYHEDQPLCAVALLDQADGSRTLANSRDAALMTRMQHEEWCGRPVRVISGQLQLA